MTRKRILPPTVLLIAILAMAGLHFLLPVKKVIILPVRYCGIALAAGGMLLATWADRLFKKARTTVKPFERSTRLVTAGPYRFSRHPMYLGMAAVVAGLAVMLGSLAPLAVIPAFVWAMEKFIRVEEKAMEETFGQAYREYRRRVRRWI